MHSVAAEDETDALIAEGAVREALAVLLRNHAERERRGGLGRDDAAAMEIPLRVAICYALLGMERDALEWCALAERAAVTQTSEDKLGQLSCFRLWSLVLDGRVLAAATYAETHFRRQRLGQDVFALSLSALILLALKASTPAFGRQLVDLIEPYDFGVGLGALMLQWLCTEFALREVLAALPVLEGAATEVRCESSSSSTERRLASRCQLLVARLSSVADRAGPWPLIREMVTTSKVAAILLGEQLMGRQPSIAPLELRVGVLNARGLAPLHQQSRFMLAALHAHGGRSALAEAWLRHGAPMHHLMAHAQPEEMLMGANGRASTADWKGAFKLYQAYVQRFAEFAPARATLAALLPVCADHLQTLARARRAGISAALSQVPSPRSTAQSASSAVRLLFERPGADLQRTAGAIIQLVETDLSRPLLVGEIAVRLGMGRRTMETRVRQETGGSVKQLVVGLRLRHAHQMVSSRQNPTTQSLRMIAFQVGFTSYRTFCSAYSRSFGRVPHARGRPRREPDA